MIITGTLQHVLISFLPYSNLTIMTCNSLCPCSWFNGWDIDRWQYWLYSHPFASHLRHVSPIWLCDKLCPLDLFLGFQWACISASLRSLTSRTLVYATIMSCIYDLIVNTLSTWLVCASVGCFSYLIGWYALPSSNVFRISLEHVYVYLGLVLFQNSCI